MNRITEIFVKLPPEEITEESDRQIHEKREVDLFFEKAYEKAEGILEKVRKMKDREEIQKNIPSWSVLNRLHKAVSALLGYHH